jgi:hypothetical protein
MGSGGSKALWSSAKLFLMVLSLISVKSARLQSNRVADRTTAMEGGSPLNVEHFQGKLLNLSAHKKHSAVCNQRFDISVRI